MKYDVEKMFALLAQGKTIEEISKTLGCSKYTVIYHTNPNRKIKQNEWARNKYASTVLLSKMTAFKKGSDASFTLKDLKEYIGENPKCYFTGEPIDLSDSSSYSLDHNLPKSRGGSSELSNLLLVSRKVNMAKYIMTENEFIDLCKQISNRF